MTHHHDSSLELHERLESYRAAREQIERETLALATSVDGVSFQFQASLYGLTLERGCYVVLAAENGARIGQVTEISVESTHVEVGGQDGSSSTMALRMARGAGLVLDQAGAPFHDAVISVAQPEEVASAFAASPDRAGLTIGELFHAPGVPATLDSGGFNRHTFMCGQSGSGKTYSLGLLLERILAETELRVIILDPNSDYVGLGRVRTSATPEAAERYRHVPEQVVVWGNDDRADHRLRLRFAELDTAAQAAVLDLDPVRDRDEYAVLADLVRQSQASGEQLISGLEQLIDSVAPGARQLGLRAQNLGVADWDVWARDQASILHELDSPTARCTVIDLGSLDTAEEQALVAQSVLSKLWALRQTRQPCLVVIDEAHNICAAHPTDLLGALSTHRTVQIAAEGRKFGLYLLASTQAPHKVHENVVAQCDNVVLMRMNSESDIRALTSTFSFVPPGLVAGLSSFPMGKALVGGKVFPRSGYVRMGARVSEEGGADIPTDWARPRP